MGDKLAELKPCPWCGEKLKFGAVIEGSTFRWRVLQGCCTDGPEVRYDTLSSDPAKAEAEARERAIAAWNERDPAILALERERDELRAMLFGCRAMLDSLRTGPDGTKYDFAQTRSGSRLNVRTVIDAIDAAMREGGNG